MKLEILAAADLKLEQLEHAYKHNNLNQMYHLLTELSRKCKAVKITRVRDENLQHACSVTEEKTIFRGEFAQQLNGTVVSFASVVSSDRKIATLINPPTVTDAVVFSKDVPHLSEFVEKFVRIIPIRPSGKTH